jgi:hypothetical protein
MSAWWFSLTIATHEANAATPRIVGRPAVEHPSFDGTENTLMYDVTVTVDRAGADADHAAVVGYVPAADFTSCTDAAVPWKWARSQTFDTTTARTWTLYNFVPGTAYRYKVMVGDPSGTVRTRCGMLPTPELPTNLANLNVELTKSGAAYDTKYVVLETSDCGTSTSGGAKYYVAAMDIENDAIVWYLDVAAMVGRTGAVGSGLRYQQGPTPQDDRVVMMVGQDSLYEWTFDGTERNFWNFAPSDECDGQSGSSGPCVNHDVYVSDDTGNTYAIATKVSTVDAMGTAWEDACGTGSRFLDDGFIVLDSSWSPIEEHYLVEDYDYDPTVDGGPADDTFASRPGACDSSYWRGTFDPTPGVIEWTHANAIAASSFGSSQVIDLSLRDWDQVVRFDADTGDRLWSLSADRAYSDWGTLQKASGIAGRADFQAQHGVHAIAENTLMMFDNRGAGAQSRVLEIELTEAPVAATITKSWAIVDDAGDPVLCPTEGTAELVPGSDHVMALCNARHAFMELDDPSGNTGTPPPLIVGLPLDATFCSGDGPSSVRDISGWRNGYPAARIGEF